MQWNRNWARRSIVLVAVLATSCGGESASTSTDGVVSTDDQSAGSEDSTSYAASFSADDPIVIHASALASQLVAALGDDDTAVSAVLRAGDAGYDGPQIEAGILASTLAADGAISGVDPRRSASGVITGFRRVLKDRADLLPIETLRREAAEDAGAQDYWPAGASATAMILALHLGGYSQEQIVDILILGAVVLDADYDGPYAEGEEECGGFVIGGRHEIPQFCDAETGELFPDEEQSGGSGDGGTSEEPENAADDEQTELCGGDFAPPYTGVPIVGVGAMLETVVLGPLETPYYYSETAGFLDIAADGSFTLAADTVRLADITIRGAPDNQVYRRRFEVAGTIDPATGDAEITGTVDGTDQLWAEGPETAVSAAASGQLAVVCGDLEPSGFFIAGFVGGQGLLEFEARP